MHTSPSEQDRPAYEAPAVGRRTTVDASLIGYISSDPVCAHLRPSAS